ncbi:MAG: hypothetical protein R2867_45210 [Caldilineaceae bacterium]
MEHPWQRRTSLASWRFIWKSIRLLIRLRLLGLLDNAAVDKLTGIGNGSPNLLLYMGFIAVEAPPTAVATATATATAQAATATSTALPTITPTGTQSPAPPNPTATNTALPTSTATSAPLNTPTSTATATSTPQPDAPTPTATPTAEPAACVDQLENGNFDAGAVAWTESSRLNFDLICDDSNCGSDLDPASGQYLAWLGGANRERAEITQRLQVPSGQPSTLRYLYQVESGDICGYDYAYVRLVVDGVTETLQVYDLCTPEEVLQWKEALIDLTPYAGQEVTVSFLTTTDYWYRSSLFIDDVAVLSGSSCPAGVTAQSLHAAAVEQPSLGRPPVGEQDNVEHAR